MGTIFRCVGLRTGGQHGQAADGWLRKAAPGWLAAHPCRAAHTTIAPNACGGQAGHALSSSTAHPAAAWLQGRQGHVLCLWPNRLGQNVHHVAAAAAGRRRHLQHHAAAQLPGAVAARQVGRQRGGRGRAIPSARLLPAACQMLVPRHTSLTSCAHLRPRTAAATRSTAARSSTSSTGAESWTSVRMGGGVCRWVAAAPHQQAWAGDGAGHPPGCAVGRCPTGDSTGGSAGQVWEPGE